jgi:hypothetical protein
MRPETLIRINLAIRECLAQCYGSKNPLVRLAQYLQRLHGDAQWTDREIGYVEIAVLRLLKLVV